MRLLSAGYTAAIASKEVWDVRLWLFPQKGSYKTSTYGTSERLDFVMNGRGMTMSLFLQLCIIYKSCIIKIYNRSSIIHG